jgi:ppGpp synthetase/RelA/SpoT-type nucleotidyltranferase
VHFNSLYPIKHKEDVKLLTEEQRKEQKKINREISSKRMKIEHIIGRIKRFNILSEKYRNRRKRFGLRLNLICGIVNYENPHKLVVS